MAFRRTGRFEIADLPKRGCQRDYIDEFFAAQAAGKEYRIDGCRVVNARYGHCADYPKGFQVEFEL